MFSISFSLHLWKSPPIQWAFLADCRALSCSTLTPSCLSLVLGGSSKAFTAHAKLSLLFPPVHDFLCSCLNYTCYFIAQSFSTFSHSGPSTIAFSKFSFLLPWIIKYLQTTTLCYTVPSPDPLWICWRVQVTAQSPGTSFHLFQPIASSSNEFLVHARDFPLIPLLHWSSLLKVSWKSQSLFDYSLIPPESSSGFLCIEALHHCIMFIACLLILFFIITPTDCLQWRSSVLICSFSHLGHTILKEIM